MELPGGLSRCIPWGLRVLHAPGGLNMRQLGSARCAVGRKPCADVFVEQSFAYQVHHDGSVEASERQKRFTRDRWNQLPANATGWAIGQRSKLPLLQQDKLQFDRVRVTARARRGLTAHGAVAFAGGPWLRRIERSMLTWCSTMYQPGDASRLYPGRAWPRWAQTPTSAQYR
jgi:hypothetical protein